VTAVKKRFNVLTQGTRRVAVPALRRLAVQLTVAAALLVFCGAVYWGIEPRTPTLGDGLWLAFTTAATVGYGDIVPSTFAGKLFSVFVVLIGFAVLSLVTASIAAIWVESSERVIEREILRDLHARIHGLSQEIAALRREVASGAPSAEGASGRPREQAIEGP
jgi:voltage-gated potassium channel